MDIITHVMIGAAASSPFWGSHPLESVMFTFGSVLPDVDALSRQFGKLAFLRVHQGWTHALPLIVMATAAGVALAAATFPILAPSVVACGLGAVLHVLLDYTNTYGVRLLAPFDRSRRCAEWVFFIDLPFIVLTVATLGIQSWFFLTNGPSTVVGVTWTAGGVGYFAWRRWLRQSARALAPAAVSLIPSAFVPWRFEGLELEDDTATTFIVDARRGRRFEEAQMDLPVVDGLDAVEAFRVMRELSPGYRAVSEVGGKVECRDLRTRSTFGTNFGRLVVRKDGDHFVPLRFDV